MKGRLIASMIISGLLATTLSYASPAMQLVSDDDSNPVMADNTLSDNTLSDNTDANVGYSKAPEIASKDNSNLGTNYVPPSENVVPDSNVLADSNNTSDNMTADTATGDDDY